MAQGDGDEVADLSHDFPGAPFLQPGDARWHKPVAVRAIITYALIAMLLLTVLLAGIEMLRGYWDTAREFSEVFLAAEMGVLGVSVTFYFVSEKD